jgi:hypothetical protein
MSGLSVTLAWLVLAWATAAVAVLLWFRNDLRRIWREPVFRRPVLVFESDDWGAGPLVQADALRDIAGVLERHRDTRGQPPVFSLALVLAVPDAPAIAASGRYHRLELDDALFAPVLHALREGVRRGVFALQLHGHEHYWPATLMASGDPLVARWLSEPPPPATERLPSHLQSRWVDASALPTRPLSGGAVRDAVAEEVRAYQRIVGEPPVAVVPPTFVWTRDVEAAWAEAGVEFVATPGWRYPRRNEQGLPDGDEGPIANGDRVGGLTYLVRTDYFEPGRGRDAAHALRALDVAVTQGRPCVLENHRDNFIGDPKLRRRSLDQLDVLCGQALARHPPLAFLATVQLGRVLASRDPQWLVTRFSQRLPAFWARLSRSGRLWKLFRWIGLAVVGAVIVRTLGRPPVALDGRRA